MVLWLWGLGSAGLIAYGVHLRVRSARIAALRTSVQGTIVDSKWNNTEEPRRYFPVVRYKVGRRSFTTVGKVAAPRKHEVGTAVEVRYDPADPAAGDVDGARMGTRFIVWGVASFAVLGGMLLLSLTM